MTDLDLDRLGDVWRQQPDKAEMERLQRSAAAVSRRARIAQIVDVGAALAVAVVVVVLVLSNPKIGTFVLGSAAILLLLGSNIRLRKLRQVELRSLSGSTEDMLDQSIERIETTLKHNRLSLIAAVPSLLVGLMVASTADREGVGSLFPVLRDIHLSRALLIGLAAVVLAVAALVTTLGIRRGRRELERLRTMREAYRHERESTTS